MRLDVEALMEIVLLNRKSDRLHSPFCLHATLQCNMDLMAFTKSLRELFAFWFPFQWPESGLIRIWSHQMAYLTVIAGNLLFPQSKWIVTKEECFSLQWLYTILVLSTIIIWPVDILEFVNWIAAMHPLKFPWSRKGIHFSVEAFYLYCLSFEPVPVTKSSKVTISYWYPALLPSMWTLMIDICNESVSLTHWLVH